MLSQYPLKQTQPQTSNTKGDVSFHRTACKYSQADWNGLFDNLRDVI